MKKLWNDRKCSNCGSLAQYRTYMYLDSGVPVPGLEFLCQKCITLKPPKTSLLCTLCANPVCEHSASVRFEAFRILREQNEPTEIHYLCSEHYWYWLNDLGPEWEVVEQSTDVNGQMIGEPTIMVRGDRPAFVQDETEQDN